MNQIEVNFKNKNVKFDPLKCNLEHNLSNENF